MKRYTALVFKFKMKLLGSAWRKGFLFIFFVQNHSFLSFFFFWLQINNTFEVNLKQFFFSPHLSDLTVSWKTNDLHSSPPWPRVLWFITPRSSFISCCLNAHHLLEMHILFFASSSLRKEIICSFIAQPTIVLTSLAA